MAVWKILTFICAISVRAESKWNSLENTTASPTICDSVPNNNNKVQCYCSRLTNHPYQINTAECYQTAARIAENDPTWDSFKTLQNISRLTLTNTRGAALTYVPTKALNYTKALLKLDIKYCNLEDIEAYAFANLSLVEEMTLRDNQIKYLAENAFTHHIRLRTISLDQNSIVEINRNVFVDLPSLEQLFLTANKITTIHDRAFVHLANLKELEIDKNSIFSLNGDTFSGLRNLEKLELSGNNLEVVGDYTFSALENLRFLNLAENKIQMLDENAFNGLSKLQTLSLEHNKLTNIENEKVFEGLTSLTSLSLKDNDITIIIPEAVIPVLSNFYGKTSQLNIDGNKLECNCRLDVFRPIINKTQNVPLSINIQNLQCYPNHDIKLKWDKIQETAKNTAQAIEDVEPQGDNVNYDYYDETELNGTIFYFDMRYILNCSADENVPEATFKTPIDPTTEKTTKLISSPTSHIATTNMMSTTLKPVTKKYTVSEVNNKGILDLSLAESITTERSKQKGNIKNDYTSNTKFETNVNVDNGIRNDRKDNLYTTTRLATVSAKPLDKQFDDREMASDEAQPGGLKAQRNSQNEIELSPKNQAHQYDGCIPLLALIILGLSIFL